MSKLCINIDHIATIREARKGIEPDPIAGAKLVINAGADGITVHLREDRRHINDRDVLLLRQLTADNRQQSPHSVLFTLEMAATQEMLEIAKKVKPNLATLVPEKRQELTTEGGLDVISQKLYLTKYISDLHANNLKVSIFINPDKKQIEAAKDIGADYVEIHTGPYAENPCKKELDRVNEALTFARSIGLTTNAGHGLNYENTDQVANLEGIEQLHIGHSVISRAVLVGLEKAIKEMKEIIAKNSPKTTVIK